MRRKLLIAGGLVVTVLIALIGAALLYLSFADLSRWRGTVERSVSHALGRELVIAGEFAPDIGLTTRLVATRVSLANPPWSASPEMVTVERLDVSIELLPLLTRRICLPELSIEGARAQLETDAGGRSNWRFATTPGDRRRRPPKLELGHIALRNVAVSYRAPSLRRALDLEVDRLEMTGDETGSLGLQLDGTLNGSSLALGGRFGPLGHILSGGPVAQDLEGRLGRVTITTRGSVESLSDLVRANLALEIRGPSASEVTELLALPSLGDGRFDVTARLSPSARGTAVSLAADLGQTTVELEGEVDRLRAPRRADATISAAGPDLAAAGALAGLERLPAAPFTLSGRVTWEGLPVRIESGEVRIGDNRLTADGALGAPPLMLETDLRFEGSGPDLAEIGRLAGLDLPRGNFTVSGRIERRGSGTGLDSVELRAAGSTVSVGGTLGDPPEFVGTDLVVDAAGPDLSEFSALARRSLPAAGFHLDGRLRSEDRGVALDGVTASVGSDRATLDGTIATTAGLIGSDLELTAEGPDLSWVAGLLGIASAPSRAYFVGGRINVHADGLGLHDFAVRIGDASLAAEGRLGPFPSLVGTDVNLRIEGADASWATELAGLSGFPAEPFEAHGHLTVLQRGYDVDGVEATLGEATMTASGRLGPIPDLIGSDLRIETHFPSLSPFDALVPRFTLPAVGASASGRITVESSGVGLDDAMVEIDGTRITAHGSVSRTANLAGSDIVFELASPDLAAAGNVVAATGLINVPALPSEPLTLKGRVAVDETGCLVDDVLLTLADATARIDGRVGQPPDFRGTDVTVASHGSDASLFAPLTGADVPPAPFRITGRIARLDTGFRFDDLKVRLGDYSVHGNGTLGEPPRYEGTDLELEARGPSLVLLEELARLRNLPDLPFQLEGRFEGNPQRFKSDLVTARLGDSDLTGSFRIDLEGTRPRLDGELGSRRIDLAEILESRKAKPVHPEPTAAGRPTSGADGLVFSDQTIPFDALGRVNGHLRWNVQEADVRLGTLTDIELDARLDDGDLQLAPIRGVGAHGGRFDGQVELAPGANDYQLRTTIQLQGAHVDLTADEDDPAEWPTLDLDLELAAVGRSRHELASSADGRIALTLGPGPVDDSVLDLLSADLVVEVLRLLNPFSEKQQASLECGVFVVELDQGRATLDPCVVQTDQTTVVGDGTVDLSTEDLDLQWVTKPRKGIGISASTLTNAYLKLGGTLAKPKIETKPLNALATTGVAIATGGLSLLGRGLFNRISAEKNLCKKALERAAQH